MQKTMEALAFDQVSAADARDLIWSAIDSPAGVRDAYSALCRWTWRVMIENRLDGELRSWHRLVLDVAGKLAGAPPSHDPYSRTRLQLDPAGAAERLKALGDLIRLSIEAAAASVPADLGRRAHVLEILRFLSERPGDYVEREAIRKATGLGEANLSRVLTLMVANGLVERLPRGKVASFRATRQGLAMIEASKPKEHEHGSINMRIVRVEPLRAKPSHFSPPTPVKVFCMEMPSDREVPGRVDHESTYTPLRVLLPGGIRSKRGSDQSNAQDREFAL